MGVDLRKNLEEALAAFDWEDQRGPLSAHAPEMEQKIARKAEPEVNVVSDLRKDLEFALTFI